MHENTIFCFCVAILEGPCCIFPTPRGGPQPPLIIGLLTTQPFGLFPELFITGASLAGVGFVLIVGCGIFLLRIQAGLAFCLSLLRHNLICCNKNCIFFEYGTFITICLKQTKRLSSDKRLGGRICT